MPGARQFVENHFADTTIGRIRLFEVRPKCLYLNTHAQRFHFVKRGGGGGGVGWVQRKSRQRTMSLSMTNAMDLA